MDRDAREAPCRRLLAACCRRRGPAAQIVRNDYQIGDHTHPRRRPRAGHVAFTFGRGKDDAVFSGNLMHSPLQTRYPESSMKFDVDPAQAA